MTTSPPDLDHDGRGDATGLAAAIREGRTSAVEAVRRVLARIGELDERLRAYVYVDGEGALAAARDADALLRQAGPPGTSTSPPAGRAAAPLPRWRLHRAVGRLRPAGHPDLRDDPAGRRLGPVGQVRRGAHRHVRVHAQLRPAVQPLRPAGHQPAAVGGRSARGGGPVVTPRAAVAPFTGPAPSGSALSGPLLTGPSRTLDNARPSRAISGASAHSCSAELPILASAHRIPSRKAQP